LPSTERRKTLLRRLRGQLRCSSVRARLDGSGFGHDLHGRGSDRCLGSERSGPRVDKPDFRGSLSGSWQLEEYPAEAKRAGERCHEARGPTVSALSMRPCGEDVVIAKGGPGPGFVLSGGGPSPGQAGVLKGRLTYPELEVLLAPLPVGKSCTTFRELLASLCRLYARYAALSLSWVGRARNGFSPPVLAALVDSHHQQVLRHVGGIGWEIATNKAPFWVRLPFSADILLGRRVWDAAGKLQGFVACRGDLAHGLLGPAGLRPVFNR